MARRWSVLGDGAQRAARQMAMFFAFMAFASAMGLVWGPPQRQPSFLAALLAGAVLAPVAWWLPWQRFDPRAPLALCVPMLAILGVLARMPGDPEAVSEADAQAGMFLLVVFVWAGVNFPAWAVWALAPPAALVYLPPRLADGLLVPRLLFGTLFLSIMVGTGLVIARQVERQRRAHAEVQRAERWRAALTSTLAHDVRSPLTAVQFALETLREDGDLPADQREQITEVAMRQARRIRRLAGGLLDADRVDAHGGLRLNARPVSLYDAAREALSYLTCPVAIEMDDDPTVYADPERLEQILINLATNAARHGKPPVIISAEPAGNGMVAVSVRDHGPGVPETKRDVLFSRFSSADAAPESVGLGLWITRELARAHGGDVSYSPAGPGARFTVLLPAADTAPPTPPV